MRESFFILGKLPHRIYKTEKYGKRKITSPLLLNWVELRLHFHGEFRFKIVADLLVRAGKIQQGQI